MTDTAPRDPNHRLESRCDECGQIDDHPRAHIGHADGSWVSVHHDCAVNGGHSDDPAIAELAATGLKGADLLAHIQNGA